MRKLLIITITIIVLLGSLFILKLLFTKQQQPNIIINDIAYSDTTQNIEFQTIKQLPIPSSLIFAGEEVPLWNFDIRERLERELTVNVFWHSSTLLSLKRAQRYLPYISSILAKYGIPDDLKYIAIIESGLANVVSPSKAVGFWQFLEETAKEFGLEVNKEIDERYNWKKSTDAACKYLLWLKERTGSWILSCAAYNCGRTALNRFINLQGKDNYFDLLLPEETERYLFRMFAFKIIFTDPKKYGYDIENLNLYPYIETQSVIVNKTISNLTEWAEERNLTYKELKYFNPWLRNNTLTVKKNKTYEIELPPENYRQIYTHLLN